MFPLRNIHRAKQSLPHVGIETTAPLISGQCIGT